MKTNTGNTYTYKNLVASFLNLYVCINMCFQDFTFYLNSEK